MSAEAVKCISAAELLRTWRDDVAEDWRKLHNEELRNL